MPRLKNMPRVARGFSLIEIVFVLGIIAIFAISVFVIYPSVRSARQAVSEQANLQQIVGVTKHMFLLVGYQNLNNDIANQAMIFPRNMNENNFQAGQDITSSWDGSVVVSPSIQVPGFFQVVYEEVPPGVCREFARAVAASYERVLINNVAIKDMINNTQVVPDPLDIVDLCKTDDPITIRIETR